MDSNILLEYESLKVAFEEAGQGHVFNYYSEYSEEEKINFINQCKQIRLIEIEKLYKELCVRKHFEDGAECIITPVEEDSITTLASLDMETEKKWKLRGAQEINNGKVALILLAGGMGSRLGFEYPKGMYHPGLPSGKCIFQVLCEKFICVQTYSKKLCEESGFSCSSEQK